MDEVQQFLSPRVDVAATNKTGKTCFKEAHGPIQDRYQNFVTRSMIGDEDLLVEALRIKEDRRTRIKTQSKKLGKGESSRNVQQA